MHYSSVKIGEPAHDCDDSKKKVLFRKSSIASRQSGTKTLKFNLTAGSDDEHSLERIHTFNLKQKTRGGGNLSNSSFKSPMEGISELYRTEGAG